MRGKADIDDPIIVKRPRPWARDVASNGPSGDLPDGLFFVEGLVAAVMKRPVPYLPADARQSLWAGSRQEAVCEDGLSRPWDRRSSEAAIRCPKPLLFL